ncbi:hypothetical protein [Burkholderia sp. BCC0044]|uniref:hypothetical protein n=1 Tax=Burkholderia sp. BCC0044 TaxID=2676295 RepID=UPI00158D2E2A|nr:hypothetical protein [Burkholderia sp. BCC0044]
MHAAVTRLGTCPRKPGPNRIGHHGRPLIEDQTAFRSCTDMPLEPDFIGDSLFAYKKQAQDDIALGIGRFSACRV